MMILIQSYNLGKKTGIIAILNEECLIPKGSDPSFLSKTKKTHLELSKDNFSVHPLSQNEFIVHHYAGPVTYNIIGFLERNKDTLPDDMRQLMSQSSNPLINLLFGECEPIFNGQKSDRDDIANAENDLFNPKNKTALSALLLLNIIDGAPSQAIDSNLISQFATKPPEETETDLTGKIIYSYDETVANFLPI
jgi:myosin heavy subunit